MWPDCRESLGNVKCLTIFTLSIYHNYLLYEESNTNGYQILTALTVDFVVVVHAADNLSSCNKTDP